jgi:hypothetical protein
MLSCLGPPPLRLALPGVPGLLPGVPGLPPGRPPARTYACNAQCPKGSPRAQHFCGVYLLTDFFESLHACCPFPQSCKNLQTLKAWPQN